MHSFRWLLVSAGHAAPKNTMGSGTRYWQRQCHGDCLFTNWQVEINPLMTPGLFYSDLGYCFPFQLICFFTEHNETLSQLLFSWRCYPRSRTIADCHSQMKLKTETTGKSLLSIYVQDWHLSHGHAKLPDNESGHWSIRVPDAGDRTWHLKQAKQELKLLSEAPSSTKIIRLTSTESNHQSVQLRAV